MKKVSMGMSWLAVLAFVGPVLAQEPLLKIVAAPKPPAAAARSATPETPSYQQPCQGSQDLVCQMAEFAPRPACSGSIP